MKRPRKINVNEVVVPQIELLRRLPERKGAEETAASMWQAYLYVRSRLQAHRQTTFREKAVEYFGYCRTSVDVSDPADFDYMHQMMSSVSQSEKSLAGNIMNRLTTVFYEHLFTGFDPMVKVEQKAVLPNGNTKRKEIDLMIGLPKIDLFISITTTPRERKKGDWPNEYNLVEATRRGVARDWEFVGLMYEGSEDERRTVQAEIPKGIKVVCVQDVRMHADFLRNIASRLS